MPAAHRHPEVLFFLISSALLLATPAFAQIDLAGDWTARSRHEDEVHRIPGPELGDFAGFPLNAAGRLKAESWDASILSQPEQQARPHPAQYSMRGPFPNFRMATVTDPLTNRLIAYTITGLFGNADRTIWMDGRPHPSARAEHTWDGFSTGEWVGSALKVTTTHMKAAFLNRNGVPASAKSVMTEYFIRHDLNLLLVSIVDDPVYLEEPFVRTSNFVWTPTMTVAPPIPFEIVDEVGAMPRGWVPSYPMGTHHLEFAKRFNLSADAAQGGRATMYPEFKARAQPWVEGSRPTGAPAAASVPARPASSGTGGVEVLPVNGRVHLVAVNDTNVVVQAGEQGAFVVDSGPLATTTGLLAAIGRLSAAPIRYLANTSDDPDHVGGNAAVSKAGLNLAAINAPGNFGIASTAAPILAHERTLGRMSAPTGARAPVPFDAWPTSTFFSPRKTMWLNGEGIELIHVPRGHTDGDVMVYFRGSDVIAAGDLFSTTSYPAIDLVRGGSVQGVLEALNTIIDIAIPRFNQQGGTRIVPGHGRICNEADVVEYRDMVTIVRDRIQRMVSSGMSLEQVRDARPTLDYDGVYGAASGPGSTDAFIEAVYRDLGRRQTAAAP